MENCHSCLAANLYIRTRHSLHTVHEAAPFFEPLIAFMSRIFRTNTAPTQPTSFEALMKSSIGPCFQLVAIYASLWNYWSRHTYQHRALQRYVSFTSSTDHGPIVSPFSSVPIAAPSLADFTNFHAVQEFAVCAACIIPCGFHRVGRVGRLRCGI